jgi:hypothetical protein
LGGLMSEARSEVYKPFGRRRPLPKYPGQVLIHAGVD